MPDHPHKQSSGLLILIGIFKLLKAAMLIALGIGVHQLLHKDTADVLTHWARAVRVDPHNYYIHMAIAKMTGLSDRTLRDLSIGTFVYAGLFLVEGAGLLLRRRWAEYMTIITTTGLLPVEVYEVIRSPTHAKEILLIANILIVIYLILNLYRTRRSARRPAASAPIKPATAPDQG
jgi:uncharacterized membrane protein (DUF2068 family)